MNLSVSNIGWNFSDDEIIYSFLQDQSFFGLEIAPSRFFPDAPYDHCDEAAQISEKLKQKYHLQICSMQSIWYGKTQKIIESESARKDLFSYTKKAIKFAVSVGCRNLVFGCPKNREIVDCNDKKIIENFLVDISDLALQNNVIIAFEANPTIYHTNFVNTTNEAIEMIKKLHHPALKINLDVSTIIENRESLSIISDNIDLINHVHISEPYLKPLKRRKLHEELKIILEDNGYYNFVSLEMGKTEDIKSLYDSIIYMKEVFS